MSDQISPLTIHRPQYQNMEEGEAINREVQDAIKMVEKVLRQRLREGLKPDKLSISIYWE